ncbi:MAG: c-type cytochrome [Rhodanobacter sp.]
MQPLPVFVDAFCVAALLSLFAAANAHAADAASIATQGNGRGAAACSACHGADGGGMPSAGFPRLAGLNAAYLHKQINDFASGSRVNAVMQPIATALDNAERQAVADYYSKLPIPAQPAAAASAGSAPDGVGALLATRGRWSDHVPACEQCHGPGGVGVGENFPPLAGQPAAYIKGQLKAWQDGTRKNDPLELMRHLSTALSAKDISAVADWFAAQPAVSKGDQP